MHVHQGKHWQLTGYRSSSKPDMYNKCLNEHVLHGAAVGASCTDSCCVVTAGFSYIPAACCRQEVRSTLPTVDVWLCSIPAVSLEYSAGRE